MMAHVKMNSGGIIDQLIATYMLEFITEFAIVYSILPILSLIPPRFGTNRISVAITKSSVPNFRSNNTFFITFSPAKNEK